MGKGQLLQYCRFCRSGEIKSIFKKEDIFIFKCLDCGIVFLGNDLDEGSIKELYEYYKHSLIANYLSPVTELRYKKLLNSFEKYRRNNFIIDIGCGAGYFMLSASSNNWNAEGTEISDEAIKLAEAKGRHVIKGDIALLELEKEKYDIATLFEIIEHASNPEGIISSMSRILRHGGALYITTPNYNSITRRLLGCRWGVFHKEHMFYFTVRGLSRLLKRYNFKIKMIKSENLSLKEFLKIFRKAEYMNESEVYKKQEGLRVLTEQRVVYSILKKTVNFILNIFKAGDSIYMLAEKTGTASTNICIL